MPKIESLAHVGMGLVNHAEDNADTRPGCPPGLPGPGG